MISIVEKCSKNHVYYMMKAAAIQPQKGYKRKADYNNGELSIYRKYLLDTLTPPLNIDGKKKHYKYRQAIRKKLDALTKTHSWGKIQIHGLIHNCFFCLNIFSKIIMVSSKSDFHQLSKNIHIKVTATLDSLTVIDQRRASAINISITLADCLAS